MTDFTILRPSALTAGDTYVGAIPASKRLSVLAAEALHGQARVRRRWETNLRNHPGGLWLFDWLDQDATWTEPLGQTRAQGLRDCHGPRWKPVLSFATDLGAALELLRDATSRGYRVHIIADDTKGIHTATVEMVWKDVIGAAEIPAEWTRASLAHATGETAEAEAITVAYLTLTRTIHPLEDACPTPT